MGRIFLTFLLTLIPLHVYADITPCSTWSSGENAATNCNAQVGCYYVPGNPNMGEAPSCNACDQYHFGVKCEKECSDTNDGAGPDFPFAHRYMEVPEGGTDLVAVRGARTKYECYKQLDGGTGNGHGAKCIGTNGEPFDDTCREYYRDGTGNNTTINLNGTTTTYIYKGNAEHHWVSCPDADNQYDIGEENSDPLDIAGYHMENTNTECYANTLPCRLFKPYFSNNSSTPLEECEFPEGETVPYSNGLWQPHGHCTSCTLSNIEAKNPNETYICHAYSATYNNDSARPHIGDQSKNNVKLYFQYYPSTWQCNACKEGYVGFVSGFANQTNQKGCLPVARGYYSGGCSSGSCYGSDSWPYVGEYQTTDGIQCETYNTHGQSGIYNKIKTFCHPCYAGMTTDNTGSTTRNDCHYTNNTNFCDAYGCVSMDQLLQNTGTSQGNWTWYMQQ